MQVDIHLSLSVHSLRMLKDCNNDLKKCVDAGAVKANLTVLSKSDIGTLFTTLSGSAASRLQFLHLLVNPSASSKRSKDQPLKRREPDYKSEGYATALRDLAARTSGGKVWKPSLCLHRDTVCQQ